MKNIQIFDGASNATFSIFQATDEEFAQVFPDDRDIEFIDDLIARLGESAAAKVLGPLWERPILKRDIQGLHGSLFYEWGDRQRCFPASKREVDWNENAINKAQRRLFRANQ